MEEEDKENTPEPPVLREADVNVDKPVAEKKRAAPKKSTSATPRKSVSRKSVVQESVPEPVEEEEVRVLVCHLPLLCTIALLLARARFEHLELMSTSLLEFPRKVCVLWNSSGNLVVRLLLRPGKRWKIRGPWK